MLMQKFDSYWAKENSETEGGDGRGLWWSKLREKDVDGPGFTGGVKGFEVLDLKKEQARKETGGESIPEGAIFGIKYQSICINIPQYLTHLLHRVKEHGTNIIKTTVNTSNGLSGVVHSAKQILLQHNPSINESSVKILINCTGLGARHFVRPEEATKLFPIRGQTLLVKGEALKARTFVGFGEEDELVYVIPRPGSGTTILGGCKQVGNWSAEVDRDLEERIMGWVRAWGLGEELRTGGERGRGFEVLSRQVGLRPGRRGGPRVELEGGEGRAEGKEDGKVEGVWVVHSYGHAGGGYQCSIGCGERVAKIVAGL